MRKWCVWYTSGFHGAARLRPRLQLVESLEEMLALLAHLDPTEPFPVAVLRTSRAKDGRRQEVVRLPEGYLDARHDDTPPENQRGTDWESALAGG